MVACGIARHVITRLRDLRLPRWPALLAAVLAAGTFTAALPAKHPTIRPVGRIHLPFNAIRHRILFATGSHRDGCGSAGVIVLEGISLTTVRASLPCDPAKGATTIEEMSFDAPHGRLSFVGHRGPETILAEVSVQDADLTMIWEIAIPDLCHPGGATRVERLKHGTAVYCAHGTRGRAVWVPRWHDRPIPDSAGGAVVRVSDAGPVGRAVALDRASGRAAVARDDGSVSIYAVPDERRIATVPGNQGAHHDEPGRAQAFDPKSGRLYVFRAGAVDAFDFRERPGTETARGAPPASASSQKVAVDPGLHRLFVPTGRGVVALSDERSSLPDAARDAGARMPGLSGSNHGAPSRAVSLESQTPESVERSDDAPTVTRRSDEERLPALVSPGSRATGRRDRTTLGRAGPQTPRHRAGQISLRGPPA